MPTSTTDPRHEARLEAVLESISDGFYAIDTDWRLVVYNRAAEEFFGRPRDEVLGHSLWELFPQGRGTPYEAMCKAAMEDGVSSTFESPSKWRADRFVELRIVPLRGGGVAVAVTDITERKRSDERQRLLVNELNHRVKNMLATVQAIAAQSLRGDDVPAAARDRFAGRLLALARANDVLVAQSWKAAGLAEIAAEAARPHGDGERFTIEGPPISLNTNAATGMALSFHELATNAVKYGALSTPGGRVSLHWRVDGPEGARRMTLTWRETGGPKVAAPQRDGFGTRLIARGLAAELRADVLMDYAPTGLVFTLSAPIAEGLQEA